MLDIIKITDDLIYLKCSCGETFECPSIYKKATCYNCESSRNLFDAKEDYVGKMYVGSSYSSDLKLKAHKIRNKFYDKYGNVAQLVKRLKLDK